MSETKDAGASVAEEEAALVARIARGDVNEPVAELQRRYNRRLYRFGFQYLRDDGLAQEMVQETFVRLWRGAGRFDASKASVGTYLFVLARSAALDLYKRPSSRPLASDADMPELAIPDSVDQIINSLVIREALDSLPAAQAEVIRLAHKEGLTQTQIAERLNKPLGTVNSTMFNGMRALGAALTERGVTSA